MKINEIIMESRSQQVTEAIDIDSIAKWIKGKFDKAAYVAKAEGRELRQAIATVRNWGQATREQKARAKEDLKDIAQFVLTAVVAGKLGATAAGIGAAQAAAGGAVQSGVAGHLAQEVVYHIIGDEGIEGIAAALGAAGLTKIKHWVHDVTSTSSGQRYQAVMNRRKARQAAQPKVAPTA